MAALVPLWWSIDDARSLTGRDPRLDAAAWIDRTIPHDDRIAADSSTLPLRGRDVCGSSCRGRVARSTGDRDLSALRGARRSSWVVARRESSPTGSSRPPRTTRARRRSTEPLARLRPAYATPDDEGRRSRPWVRVYRIYACRDGTGRRLDGLAVGSAVFLSGAVLLGVEIAASRVLAPTFGSSLYVWGALIGVVLTGLSIGYWAGGALADRWPSPYLFVGAIALGAGLVARDPGRRRLGARAGRHLGSGAEARPARRGDRRSSAR